MTSTGAFRLGLAVALVLLPVWVYANAGTPLMWASALHLVIGNALIGIAEGALLGFWLKVRKRIAIPVMVAANYASAWLGALILPHITRDDLHLYNAWGWVWTMVAAMFALTLLVELPFVAFCLRWTKVARPRWLTINFLVQTASYAVLVGWYYSASRVSLYTRFQVVSVSQIPTTAEAQIFYISQDDGDVYSMRLDGTGRQRLFPLASRSLYDRLGASLEGGKWVLGALMEKGASESSWIGLATNLSVRFGDDPLKDRDRKGEITWSDFGPVAHFGDTAGWEFETRFWAAGGLTGLNTKTGERLQVAFETPFLLWYVRHATALPSGQVIFQLGPDQICLLDPDKKKIGLLGRGRGPVVALGEPGVTNRVASGLPK